jgi:cell division protein FtsN
MAAKTAHPSTGTPPSSPVVKQATIRTAPVAPAKTAPTRTASTAAPQAAALSSAGAYTLQVGSFKSRADAEASWTQFHSRHAAVVGGASHTIREANLGPKGDWFRLQVGSFASRDAATAFCAKLKANGASCFPTK